MSFIKYTVGVFAFTWSIVLLTACGASSDSGSSTSSSSTPEARQAAEARLLGAQNSANLALERAQVQSVPAASPGSCALASPNSGGSQFTQLMQALDTELQAILADAQNQDQAALDADLQNLQDDITKQLNDLITQVQACIPNDPTAGANIPPVQGTGTPNSPFGGIDLTQFLGQIMGGAH